MHFTAEMIMGSSFTIDAQSRFIVMGNEQVWVMRKPENDKNERKKYVYSTYVYSFSFFPSSMVDLLVPNYLVELLGTLCGYNSEIAYILI